MYRISLVVPIVIATVATVSAADPVGFIQRLPRDGSWAKYQEGETEGSGTLTLRMVGTTTEYGQKCRWLEIESAAETGKTTRVSKILVRENDFAAGAKKTPEVLRGWVQVGENAITAMSDDEKPEATMLFQRQKDGKTVKSEKVIDYQKGQLKIATAKRGKLDHPEPGLDITQTIWSDTESPFGTAAMDLSVKAGDMSLYDGEMTLQDHGTGAKSALPDNN